MKKYSISVVFALGTLVLSAHNGGQQKSVEDVRQFDSLVSYNSNSSGCFRIQEDEDGIYEPFGWLDMQPRSWRGGQQQGGKHIRDRSVIQSDDEQGRTKIVQVAAANKGIYDEIGDWEEIPFMGPGSMYDRGSAEFKNSLHGKMLRHIWAWQVEKGQFELPLAQLLLHNIGLAHFTSVHGIAREVTGSHSEYDVEFHDKKQSRKYTLSTWGGLYEESGTEYPVHTIRYGQRAIGRFGRMYTLTNKDPKNGPQMRKEPDGGHITTKGHMVLGCAAIAAVAGVLKACSWW